jgi:hypothetical protein
MEYPGVACVPLRMDALVIGSSRGLANAVAHALRRRGRSVLQAIPADVAGPERIDWLLDEAGRPPLVVIVDEPPYTTAHELLGQTDAHIVLVAEHRAPIAGKSAVPRSYTPVPMGRGLAVVTLGRTGRRWFPLGGGRTETLGPSRAAALVLRACRLSAPAPAA